MDAEKKDQFVEETVVKDAVKASAETEETVVKDAPGKAGERAEDAPKEKGIPVWKSVLMGAIPGAAVGAASVLSQMDAHGQDGQGGNDDIPTPPEDDAKTEDAPVFVPEGEVKVAEGVDDSMSFSEAFGTARAEVGAGGAFTWHGNVYSTYYGTEWNALSPEQQDQYGHAVASTDIKPEPYTDEPAPVEESGGNSDVVLGEVEIVDVETVETPVGPMDVAHGYVGDHAAAFIDGDQDDVIDAVAVDINDNLQMEPEELYEPAEEIHMSDLADAAGGSADDVQYTEV